MNGDGTDDLVGFNVYQYGTRVMPSSGSAFEPQQNWGDSTLPDSPRPAARTWSGTWTATAARTP